MGLLPSPISAPSRSSSGGPERRLSLSANQLLRPVGGSSSEQIRWGRGRESDPGQRLSAQAIHSMPTPQASTLPLRHPGHSFHGDQGSPFVSISPPSSSESILGATKRYAAAGIRTRVWDVLPAMELAGPHPSQARLQPHNLGPRTLVKNIIKEISLNLDARSWRDIGGAFARHLDPFRAKGTLCLGGKGQAGQSSPRFVRDCAWARCL